MKNNVKKIIEVPHLVQYYNIDDKKWQEKSCGIVSLAMILEYYDINFNINELIGLGLEMDGYIEGIGWKHQVICDVAEHYGLKSYRTEDNSIENLVKSIDKNEPVIISIYKSFDPANGGHLTVLNGYYIVGEDLLGLYINDPIGAQYKHKNKFIKLDKFICGWKKRAIYITKK